MTVEKNASIADYLREGSRSSDALIFDRQQGRWLLFRKPVSIFSTRKVSEVRESLREIERRVERDSLHAAGFVTYEAAPAFDDRFPGQTGYRRCSAPLVRSV